LLRGNLTPLTLYTPFYFGSLVHYALDQRYTYGIDHLDAIEAFKDQHASERAAASRPYTESENETIEKQAALARQVLAHYDQWARTETGPYADRNLEFVSTEQAFRTPIRTARNRRDPRFVLAGRFDGVVRSKTDGLLYLWEIKTTRSIGERVKQLALEEQANAYTLAAQDVLGQPIAGIVYTLIRKKAPESPRVLKNGLLSRAVDIDTTADHFVNCVRAHHGAQATREFIKANYNDVLAELLTQPNKFFARVVIRRTREELQTAARDLYAVAREMRNPNTPVYAHAGTHCNYCLFREPCLAVAGGRDPQPLLQAGYTRNTYHEAREGDE
jgi:hypothetical protein